VVRASDRTIVAGNHTWLAAKSLGWSEIAAVLVDDDEATAQAFALADNRTAELGSYDERELLDLMSEAAPDAEVGGEPQPLAVRLVCTELRRRLEVDESDARVSPQRLRDCLRSLSESFGSGSQKRSMIHVRGLGPDSLRITLHRPWRQIRSICERRRAVAQAPVRPRRCALGSEGR
jgi:hypothetical protein